MNGIIQFWNNWYVRLLVISVITFVGTFLAYLKKSKKEFEEYDTELHKKIEKRYSEKEYSPKIVIQIIRDVDQIDEALAPIRSGFNLVLYGGLGFIGACLWGVVAQGKSTEVLATVGISLGFLAFLIGLITVIVWDYSLKRG